MSHCLLFMAVSLLSKLDFIPEIYIINHFLKVS